MPECRCLCGEIIQTMEEKSILKSFMNYIHLQESEIVFKIPKSDEKHFIVTIDVVYWCITESDSNIRRR